MIVKMTTKDIDEIFEIMQKNEADYYLDEFYEDYSLMDLWDELQDYRYENLLRFSNKVEENNNDTLENQSVDEVRLKLEKLYENIMAQIEENPDLYEYFTLKTKENREIYGELLSYTKNHISDIEKFLRESIYDDTSNEIITSLIKATGNVKKFLYKNQNEKEVSDGLTVGNIVKGFENIDEFLMSDNVLKSQLRSYEIVRLIVETGHVEKYLTMENIKKFKLNKGDAYALLNDFENIDEILTPEFAMFLRFG